MLNIISRKRTTSSSSNDGSEDKSPSRPASSRLNKFFHIPKLGRQSKEPPAGDVDSRVKTASGHYSVAPRDVSVLERISHKAHNRASRVRKPHEVHGCGMQEFLFKYQLILIIAIYGNVLVDGHMQTD